MTDALVLLKQDHKAVEKLFKKFEGLGDNAHTTKRQVVDAIITELSIHAAIEEQVLYPGIRSAVPDLESDVLEGLEEHHVVKWTLDELKDLDPENERFDAKVTVLMESVRHHVEEEETELFPEVRKAMGRKLLQEMGEELERAKAVAPKEPHPKAPDTPPGNVLAGMTTSALDAVEEKTTSLFRRRR